MVEETERKGNSICRHHWIIQPAFGLVSQGVCQKCKEVREFDNYVDTPDWAAQRKVSGGDLAAN